MPAADERAGNIPRISMRKQTLLALLTLTLALPAFAARNRSESYITYDDGGTVIRQAEDGKEMEGRVNMPIFPGDEVATSRRGRVEIRLSDGNILALDRATAVRFRSVLDSYEGGGAQTVVELKFGHVAVERSDDGSRDMLRVDTPSASYAAIEPAVYAIDADTNGRDRITVFDGAIEVRTPARTTRVREGEEAHVDGDGIYGLVSSHATDDFERWFVRRSESSSHTTSRYLDHSIAYAERDLDPYGKWVYVSSYDTWCWRPVVNIGWRPYYNGYWRHSPGGVLVWVSYEPWGWTPYHYGRWAYDSMYGWVWAPGSGYAPAWVYWMYGSSYVGWAPMGWYDCYRPYYGWAYRPYSRAGIDYSGGFYGNVRPSDIDLRPWTFVHPNSLTATRVDQAALTTDAVRARLLRGGDGALATVTNSPARFSRTEIKDPAAAVGAIARRGIGSGTGTGGSGLAAGDMTPFFRRDPELSNAVRDRIVRSRPVEDIRGGGSGGSIPALSGVPTPGSPGTLEGRVSRGESRDSGSDSGRAADRVGAVNRGDGSTWRRDSGSTSSLAPAAPSTVDRGSSRSEPTVGRIIRDRDSSSTTQPVTRDNARGDAATWRDYRLERPSTSPNEGAATERAPDRSRDEQWRGRVVGRTPEASSGEASPRSSAPADRGSADRTDVPRRIIDRIGGARIYDEPSSSRDRGSSSRDSAPRASEPRSVPRDSGSRDSGRVERSSPPPSHDSGSHSSAGSSSGGSSSHQSSGASRAESGGGNGKIKRD